MLQIILCAALLFSTAPSLAALIDRTAAIVNTDIITLSDIYYFGNKFHLRKELDPFLSYFKKKPESPDEVIQYLIQENLVLQKQAPTKEEIEEEINTIQRTNKIDREKLRDVLKSQGIDFDDYTAMMKVSVAKHKLIDRELRGLSVVSDEDVKNYYYTAAEYRRDKGSRLILSYHLEQLAVRNREDAESATARLKQGDTLEGIASAMTTGQAEYTDLGMLPEDRLSSVVNGAIQGLRVGEFSAPIATGSGFLILRIREIGAPQDPVFEKEKENIRNRLFQKAIERHLESWTEREKAQSYIFIP